MASKPPAAIAAQAHALLVSAFGPATPAPEQVHFTAWATDPFALGATSAVAVGGLSDDFAILAEPVGRLHFAGEATHRRYRATAHGAWLSGVRGAGRVLQALSRG
jgi:monoamine oxidase